MQFSNAVCACINIKATEVITYTIDITDYTDTVTTLCIVKKTLLSQEQLPHQEHQLVYNEEE